MTDHRCRPRRWTPPVLLAAVLWAVPSPAHACISGTQVAVALLLVWGLPLAGGAALQLALAGLARERLWGAPRSALGWLLASGVLASVVVGLGVALGCCGEGLGIAGVPFLVLEVAVLRRLVGAVAGPRGRRLVT